MVSGFLDRSTQNPVQTIQPTEADSRGGEITVTKRPKPKRKKARRRKQRKPIRAITRTKYTVSWVETITELPNPASPTYRQRGWGPSYSHYRLQLLEKAERIGDHKYAFTIVCKTREEVESFIQMVFYKYPECIASVKTDEIDEVYTPVQHRE